MILRRQEGEELKNRSWSKERNRAKGSNTSYKERDMKRCYYVK